MVGAGKQTGDKSQLQSGVPLGENVTAEAPHFCVCVREREDLRQSEPNVNISASLGRKQAKTLPSAEVTFTTLRMIRLKSPINWPEGSSISFSSWSTDLCCRPIPKRRAWGTGNLLEWLPGQAFIH